ncbi:cyclodeaminase/cyclohydrolase family protein [Eggerthellaceae bacterium zg-997]|nr:cyclodeaminase/cyclohydrolase family protein [Eggerthellaceae bacterium zg-997]
MSLTDLSLRDFSEKLASAEPVPGGGGAAAYAGALGCDLGSMVGNLTVGKKRYADVEDEVRALTDECARLSAELTALVDSDAEAFAPLARAYSIPKDSPERGDVMEAALNTACEPPLQIMRTAARGIDAHARLAQIGSRLVVSDAGAGVALCRAALQAASLSVFINTKSMTDRSRAAQIEAEADELLATYVSRADQTFDAVAQTVRPAR